MFHAEMYENVQSEEEKKREAAYRAVLYASDPTDDLINKSDFRFKQMTNLEDNMSDSDCICIAILLILIAFFGTLITLSLVEKFR